MWESRDYYRNPAKVLANAGESFSFKHSVLGDVTVTVSSRKGIPHVKYGGQKAFKAREGALIAVRGYVVCRIREVRKNGQVMLTSCDVTLAPGPFALLATRPN